MPVKYSGPSDESSPSLPSRLVRKVSNPVGSFKGRKHARFESRSESDHSESQRSRRYNTKFPRSGIGRDGDSLRQHSGFIADGSHDSQRQPSEESVTAGTTPFWRRRRSHTLETVQEVASGQTSRRTTVVNGSHSEPELAQQVGSKSTPGRLRVQHSSACSDMHQSVKSGDYLLARGANPRTGVVTPAHSASSSLDDHKTTTQVPHRPPRWRQKGDQWVSLDLGEPTPTSVTPSVKLPEHPRQASRMSREPVMGNARDSMRESSLGQTTAVPDVPSESGVTFHLDQTPTEKDLPAPETTGELEPTFTPSKLRFDMPVKRKPVGSPASRSAMEPSGHADEGSDDSTDTVLRKPRFQGDLRTSSAPDPIRGRLLNTSMVNKDLPRVPPDTFSFRNQATPKEDPFLGPVGADQPANVPVSNTFTTSGPSTTEKELPCLPTSNGPSQSKLNSPPYPVSPTKEANQRVEEHQQVIVEAPRGPRDGSDPAYPYNLTARPTYHVSPPIRGHRLIGERAMPTTVHDNPPKRPSPLIRTTWQTVVGPRSIPPPEMSVPERTRLALAPLSNATTTSIDISMDRSGLPKPLHIGPRSMKPDLRVMNRGHPGFLRSPPPSVGSDIIMNTAMNIRTDNMVSIPMPRTRPRAMIRPAMPMRAEGIYGIPKIDVGREASTATGMEHQRPSLPQAVRPALTAEYREGDSVLMEQPLDPQVHATQDLTSTKGTHLDCAKAKSKTCGLMRKCSRCNQGYVNVKLHDIDSVIHTSDLLKASAEAQEATEQLHPCRSPLPQLPEEPTVPKDEVVQQNTFPLSHRKEETDERDHGICCPRCCILDCHEGCLGHPTPTPSPSPTNIIWSAAQTPSVFSEVSSPATEKDVSSEARTQKVEENVKSGGLNFVKAALKLSPRKDQTSKSGNHIQAALYKPRVALSTQPPTPVRTSIQDAQKRQATAIAAAVNALRQPEVDKPSEAIPAAVSAIASAQPQVSVPRPGVHKRQRSISLPSIGLRIVSQKVSGNGESSRAVSSGLGIPSPIGLALSCAASKNGSSRSRNISGTSVNSIEIQIPNLASYTAIIEILLVPFEATKMWVKTHPQIFSIGRDGVRRAWEMAQIITRTAWRLWAFVFIYSKTGELKFNARKGETAGGLLIDLTKSVLYFLVLAAVTALVLRTVGLVLGVLRMGIWFFKAVFWVARSILGLGTVK